METKIKFKGNEYLLIGNLAEGGAIATQEQYENFERPYAYLFETGEIMRFNEIIGHREDIEVIGKVEPNLKLDRFIDEMFNPTW